MVLLVPFLQACGKEEITSSAALGSGDLKWSGFPVPLRVDKAFMDEDKEVDADIRAAVAFWEEKAGRKNLFYYDSNPEKVWNENYMPYSGDVTNPTTIFENVIMKFPGSWPFKNESDVAAKTLVMSTGNEITRALVLLNSEKELCGGGQDCLVILNEPGINRRNLIAHELGHFLGLGHDTDKQNMMFPSIQRGISLDAHTVNQAILDKVTNAAR